MAPKQAGVDAGTWDRLAFVLARGKAEALDAVDAMELEDAFMWLHYQQEQHEAEEKAMRRK